MSTHRARVFAGIDVGGLKKGFHAVALRRRHVLDTFRSTKPEAVAAWCREVGAHVVGVDAPCGWSRDRGSRACERELAADGIRCFSTPTRARAGANPFYSWVRNGEALYAALASRHPLFDGTKRSGPVCFETFPHGVVCALAGRVVAAHPKGRRRQVLSDWGLDVSTLGTIDEIDAALCAVSAAAFGAGPMKTYGTAGEGMLLLPRWRPT